MARQGFVCYGPGLCEEGHEPPDPDCWKCARVFWNWALGNREDAKMAADNHTEVVCRQPGCDGRFVWVNVHKQHGGVTRMPVELAELADGNIAVGEDWKLGRMLRKGEGTAPGETRHVAHFVNCKNPSRFRRRDKPPAAPPRPAAPTPADLFGGTPGPLAR